MTNGKLIIDLFLDLFFPKRCVGCGEYGDFLCFDCVGKIEKMITPVCAACGKITQYGEYCKICKRRIGTNLDGLIIAAKYDEGPTKEMIHHLKYSGFLPLADLLGEMIVERLKGKIPKDTIVVPVPLHLKRESKRGFNQAELIAMYVSKRLKLHGGLALKRIKNTETQIKLSREKRLKNLIGAFICTDKKIISAKNIFLIDDVTTTGTTLEECASVLKSAGAKKVYGVVVAKRI